MSAKSAVKWSVKEIVRLLRERQLNKFDANLGISGARGDGKSTLLRKIFKSFKRDGFRPIKHQVYSRDDVINLLSNQQFGFCWDDEAINSGYKRDFGKSGQIELIKIITNYRDNYNLYASALPFFYSLDKALRELIFMHIHIIERGVGVVLLPLAGQIHSQDPWDTMNNKRIEERENRRMLRDPNRRFRYHLLTTFAGYIFFNKMTEREEENYKKIKKLKRAKEFEVQRSPKDRSHTEKLYDYLMTGKLTKEMLLHSCYMEGVKYSTVASGLNVMLKNKGVVDKSLTDLLATSKSNNNKLNDQISMLVPDI